MIFVTVGTHEQQFNRLIEKIDNLKKDGIIEDDVFIQIGFSTYEPRYCEWKKLVSYDEMTEYISKARVVITHGGPATFMSVLSSGKKPIVVPRLKKFGEHVNDHQLKFCKEVEKRLGNIVVVQDIVDLSDTLTNFSHDEAENSSNTKQFCQQFLNVVSDLFDRE